MKNIIISTLVLLFLLFSILLLTIVLLFDTTHSVFLVFLIIVGSQNFIELIKQQRKNNTIGIYFNYGLFVFYLICCIVFMRTTASVNNYKAINETAETSQVFEERITEFSYSINTLKEFKARYITNGK